MFHRERPEKEYAQVRSLLSGWCHLPCYSPLYQIYGMGTTAFSCLAGGLLTGKVRRHSQNLVLCLLFPNSVSFSKYNDGIPEGSRFTRMKHGSDALQTEEGKEQIANM